ncbi:unnamed protein product [Orchesella dallaii]|uniref:Gustatory receptor n=1 Tax=Orchesella dallaii TaxID=48710 RepID=A0ABP1RTB2_9HEXA
MVKLSVCFLSVFSFLILFNQVHNGNWWEHMELMATYVVICSYATLGAVTIWTVEHGGGEHCWMINQQLRSLDVHQTDFSFAKVTIQELFIYSFFIVFSSAAPTVTFALPIFINFSPIQLLISRAFPDPLIFPPCAIMLQKLADSFWLTFTITFGAPTCLSYLFGVVAVVEMNQNLLDQLTPRTAENHRIVQHIFVVANPHHNNHFHIHRQRPSLFQYYLRQFRILQIEIVQHNYYDRSYVPTLTTLGVCLSVSGYFVGSTSYHRVPVFLYYFLMFMSIMVTSIICIITRLASVPSEKFLDFLAFWKTKLTKRSERQELRSCSPIAYEIKPFLKVKKSTTFDILTCILNNTMVFVMLK